MTAQPAAPPFTGRPRTVLVAGSVPFDSPWLTDQNLATALAEKAGVLYVEPPISPLTPFRTGSRGNPAAALVQVARKPMRRRGGVNVVRPVALPPLERAIARRISAPFVRQQMQRTMRTLDHAVDAAVLTRRLPLPTTPRVVCYLVKDWTPAGADLIGRNQRDLLREILKLAASADVVLAISEALQRRLAEHGVESRVLRHGFHAALAGRYDGAEVPGDLAVVPEPRLVYAGRIDGRLDVAMLGAVADRFASGSLVLVGPLSPRLAPDPGVRALLARDNVHALGNRDRVSLPAYLVHADCLLLPYAKREWSRFGSPLKLWDYLYAGPPLVGTGYTVLAEYPPPLVHFVEDPDEFPERIAEALVKGRRGAERRRAFALANTWDHRADELLALLASG
jgi:teichuronic acid biosynthesis glycosyltransferase TuaH